MTAGIEVRRLRRTSACTTEGRGAGPGDVTALPSWMRQRRSFAKLIATADGDVPRSTRDAAGQTKGEIPFLKPAEARGWVAEAARSGAVPGGAPTYSYLAAFNSSGKLIGLSAEGPLLSWPEGIAVRAARSDPANPAGRSWVDAKTKLKAACTSGRPVVRRGASAERNVADAAAVMAGACAPRRGVRDRPRAGARAGGDRPGQTWPRARLAALATARGLMERRDCFCGGWTWRAGPGDPWFARCAGLAVRVWTPAPARKRRTVAWLALRAPGSESDVSANRRSCGESGSRPPSLLCSALSRSGPVDCSPRRWLVSDVAGNPPLSADDLASADAFQPRLRAAKLVLLAAVDARRA